MSVDKLHLNRLLKLLSLSEKDLMRELRADVRAQEKKESGDNSGGGNFYDPFWRDLKDHVARNLHITPATQGRIAANSRRRNLYPVLEQSFLKVISRGGNQEIAVLKDIPKGKVTFAEAGLTIRVESILPLTIEGDLRLAYAYWSLNTPISNSAIRLGLWLMSEALDMYDLNSMRIYDAFRGVYHSTYDFPLLGDEEQLLLIQHNRLVELRNKIIADRGKKAGK